MEDVKNYLSGIYILSFREEKDERDEKDRRGFEGQKGGSFMKLDLIVIRGSDQVLEIYR
jgi:hypothetical protein